MVRRGAADAIAVGLGAVLLAAVFFWARIEAPSAAAPPRTAPVMPARSVSDVPRIGLDRIEAPPAPRRGGGRDVFAFGAARAAAPIVVPPPGPVPVLPAPAAPAGAPQAPGMPSLEVKFIGAVERDGARVAVLMTEQKEILTALAGQVVANRLRVMRIGLESVDVQDVGGGATRRLPLRAN